MEMERKCLRLSFLRSGTGDQDLLQVVSGGGRGSAKWSNKTGKKAKQGCKNAQVTAKESRLFSLGTVSRVWWWLSHPMIGTEEYLPNNSNSSLVGNLS